MLPTWVLTSSNKPERLDMIAAVSSDLIQSEIALRTVSTQRHHPSRKMVDKGLALLKKMREDVDVQIADEKEKQEQLAVETEL